MSIRKAITSVMKSSTIKVTNNQPIIGIVTQPMDPDWKDVNKDHYITASYVKWVESAGARAVPIFYNSSHDELKKVFNQINGILYTGGGTRLEPGQPYYETCLYLYNLATDANDKGDFFPIWGSCQGNELLCCFAAKTASVLTDYDAWDISYKVNFLDGAFESTLFNKETTPANVIEYLSTLPVTMHYHKLGVHPDDFYKHKIDEQYKLLAVNTDRKGRPYVTAMENKKYPFYSTIFHPECPMFEFIENTNVDHSQEAIVANSYLALFFVNECRKNNHHFEFPEEERNSLMYNYHPTYTYKTTGDEQTYFWPQ
jgi:gamma-glutamyl hydrolase